MKGPTSCNHGGPFSLARSSKRAAHAIKNKNQGFTLAELISVLVITGIIAAVAAPRFFNQTNFDARRIFDQAQAMLRYAQKIAIAQNRNVHVRLDGNSFALCFNAFAADGSCASQVLAPTGKNSNYGSTSAACSNSATWFCEVIPSGVTYASSPAITQFYFNALGQPYLSTDTPPTSNFTRLDISLAGSGVTHHLYVERETGYVHP